MPEKLRSRRFDALRRVREIKAQYEEEELILLEGLTFRVARMMVPQQGQISR